MSLDSQSPKTLEMTGAGNQAASLHVDFTSVMKDVCTSKVSAPASPMEVHLNSPYERNKSQTDALLVADDKGTRGSQPDTFRKMSPEEQKKEATYLASEIADKGFKDHRDLRDRLRSDMLRVYLEGDKNGAGNDKALDAFIKQINDSMPRGMSVKLAQPKDDPDYAKFMKNAEDLIAKHPGAQLGTHGQIQLWKTEDGKEKLVDKTHFAAEIKKQVDRQA